MLLIIWEPISGFDKTEGDFHDKTQPSLSTWFEVHAIAKWTAAIVVLGAVTLGIMATGTNLIRNS
jgi:hypothetical protein